MGFWHIVLGVVVGNLICCGVLVLIIRGEEVIFHWRFRRRTGHAFTSDMSRNRASELLAERPASK